MQIKGFNKTTLLDYPKHLAATIFVGGCNMRCPFCHNASLVTRPSSQPSLDPEEVLDTLSKRRNILEGVCITGGEPTLYPDLPDFIKDIKALGLKVKLDTNGTHPKMMIALAEEGLVDYVAMDIKNSLEKYPFTAGIAELDMDAIKESVAYLIGGSLEYEFRTTIVKEYHTREDILAIGAWLKGARAYYLQGFMDSGDLICPGLSGHNKKTMKEYVALLTPYITEVSIRGLD